MARRLPVTRIGLKGGRPPRGPHPCMEDWELAAQAALERKAVDLTALSIGSVSALAEQFVICHGTNSRQVQAIADSVREDLRDEGRWPLHVEGYRSADWILLDYGDFVVHVFSKDRRYYYDLERLWRKAPRLPIPEAPTANAPTATGPSQRAAHSLSPLSDVAGAG